MTNLDRAFIRAFTDAPLRGASHASINRPHVAAESPSISAAAEPSEAEASIVAVERPARPVPRPLSSFAAQPKVHDTCRALLEVDRLEWPEACIDLLERASREWDRFGEQLAARAGRGQKCVALASVDRGDGRTIASLALAKHLSARGQRVVVVDADGENPDLARSCGVSVHTGWDDLIASDLALGEALIASVDEGVTLMPWRGAAADLSKLAARSRVASVFGTLREHYDLIVLDAPPLAGQTTIAAFAAFATAVHLDALYLIHNVRASTRVQLTAACAKLRRGGLPLVGVIENFTSPSAEHASAGPETRSTGQSLAVYS